MPNPRVLCPMGCGDAFPNNTVTRHARRCLGADPTIEDLCRAGDVIKQQDGCWVWRANCQEGNPDKYGLVSEHTRDRFAERYAHRLALILDGSPPGELCGLHYCDNPPCINPRHLHVGTKAENSLEMKDRGRSRSGVQELAPRDTRICPMCDTEFTVYLSSQQKYCSESCHVRHDPPNRKLTENEVLAIRDSPRTRGSAKIVADRYGVDPVTIRKIWRGLTWRHLL